MATVMKKCKVCGQEYEYCHTLRKDSTVFRYQDVACCPEHGNIYLSRILVSRGEKIDNGIIVAVEPVEAAHINAVSESCFVDNEYDELFEHDFEDEEDD